ncbi:MAG: hypothetical protein E6K73_01495 [Candidatus Eisenbacteria bacterium]|uniref:Uncharacterized protein n=1 Tax=Eiseniibacteriota bacterium TaxID=2212470 RepID=A0A538SPS8_UNCEI|nr:MAG: hypothetical protein E6K73_01495 [Candidatus Eisenbacteria bacterium]
MNYCLPVSMNTSPVNDLASLLGAPPRKDLVVMRTYDLTHLSDPVLLRGLNSVVAQERGASAEVLAYLAEVDERRLYLLAGFPSIHAFCVGELRFSEDAAYKRIQAARTARRLPAIFDALAEGRLHLAAVCLLAPHLTPENANELLAAATHHSKSEIDQLLAQRFPRTEWLSLVQPIPAATPRTELAPGQLASHVGVMTDRLAPGQVEAPVSQSKAHPLSPERFAVHFTIGKETHDKLCYVQALLSHRLPSGDVGKVFDRSLDALKRELEKKKLAATSRPRPSARTSANPRHIPAHVKRAVWQRDQGQCTFVSPDGHRCGSRRFLEFDHVEPVARGGRATVEGLRLYCRLHNQYEAERTFGSEFMSAKREEARRAAAEAKARVAATGAEERTRAAKAEAEAQAAEPEARSRALAEEHARDVMSCLRELGFRASDARRAVEFSMTTPDATLEERVRTALKSLCPKTRFHGRVGTNSEART